MSRSLRPTAYVHLVGVALAIASILLNGPLSHDTGVAIAIGTVSLLGAKPLPTVDHPAKLQLVIGSITSGGMRQGQFIKSLFAVALLASGGIQLASGTLQIASETGVPTALLGAALGVSAIANEFEIRTLEQRRSAHAPHSATGVQTD